MSYHGVAHMDVDGGIVRVIVDLLVRSSGLLLVALAACRPGPAAPVYPGELQPPSRFGRDFLLHQRVVVRRGEAEHALQTALQVRGDTLTLIGLTPLGTRAFVLTQRGRDVSFTSSLPPDQQLPFEPRFVLHDVQRALLPVLDDRPMADGEHRVALGDEVVTERWAGRRLLERRFRRRAPPPGGELVIRYAGGYVYGEAPGPIELDNGWLGYRVELETLGYTPLARPSPGASGRYLPRAALTFARSASSEKGFWMRPASFSSTPRSAATLSV